MIIIYGDIVLNQFETVAIYPDETLFPDSTVFPLEPFNKPIGNYLYLDIAVTTPVLTIQQNIIVEDI